MSYVIVVSYKYEYEPHNISVSEESMGPWIIMELKHSYCLVTLSSHFKVQVKLMCIDRGINKSTPHPVLQKYSIYNYV